MTLEQFEALSPNSTDRLRLKFLVPLNSAMEEFGINTPLRIAAFMAQILHESGSFRYVEELASGKAYEYRKDLGNLDKAALKAAHAQGATTGRFYKGRGPIQITGYYNYRDCGKALDLDLVNNPVILTDPLNGCRAAAWFWSTRKLNALADEREFKRITRVINGGYTHLKEREANYLLCTAVLGCSDAT